MTITQEEFMAGIAPIEERYSPKKYTDQEMKDIYEIYKGLTFDNWKHLCGRVLALGFYRIPSETIFKEVYNEHRNVYKKYKNVRVACDDCRGYGVRMWLRRIRSGHDTPSARCECENGENWPAYPSEEVVRSRADFVRWLGAYEIPGEAIEKEGVE